MAKNGKRLGFLPDWRIFTYVILVVNLIFLIWIITGASSGDDKKNCSGLTAQQCHDANTVGKGIGVALIIILWVIIDVILAILWLITNRKKRDCPVCGHSVKKGQFTCKNCGHDFRNQYQQQPQGYPQGQQNGPPPGPQPQYPDPSGFSNPPRRPGPGS